MHEVRLADWYNPFSFIVHKIFFIRLVSVSLTEARGSQINLRPGFYTVAFHILHASSLCSLVAQLTYRNIHLCCFYLLSAAWLSLSFLPFCNTFHAHLKVVGCFFFVLFVLLKWDLKRDKVWAGLKSSISGCGHNWTFLLCHPFGNHWYRAFICVLYLYLHCFIFSPQAL